MKTFAVVFVCFTCLGYCVGNALYFLSPYLPFGAWQLVITPPVKAVQLIAYAYPDVYIRAEDDNLYVCHLLTTRQVGENARCAQTDAAPAPINSLLCRVPNAWKPSPPGKVVDELSVRNCAANGYVDTHFIVIEDGTVWRWQNAQGGYGAEQSLLVFGGMGAAVGAVTGIVTFLGSRLVKIVRRSHHGNSYPDS